jgi:hypothetical protein
MVARALAFDHRAYACDHRTFRGFSPGAGLRARIRLTFGAGELLNLQLTILKTCADTCAPHSRGAIAGLSVSGG